MGIPKYARSEYSIPSVIEESIKNIVEVTPGRVRPTAGEIVAQSKLRPDLENSKHELLWINKPFLDYHIQDGTAYIEYIGVIQDEPVFRTDYLILDAYRNGIRHIDMLIHSFGGDPFAAVTFYYILKGWEKRGVKVTTSVYGCVASAAVAPFLAGSERLATPHAMIMIHDMRSFMTYPYRTTTNQEQDAFVSRKIQRNFSELEYLNLRPKTLTQDQLEEFKKQDFWMNAQESLKYGFVDKIIYTEGE
jgi:ATP-dependent protease ClpP protease subunit